MNNPNSEKDYWLLADAKNRFSEVTKSALLKGPQTIYRREGNVVVLSEKEYLKLTGKSTSLDFKSFILQSTPDLSDLALTRDTSTMRNVTL